MNTYAKYSLVILSLLPISSLFAGSGSGWAGAFGGFAAGTLVGSAISQPRYVERPVPVQTVVVERRVPVRDYDAEDRMRRKRKRDEEEDQSALNRKRQRQEQNKIEKLEEQLKEANTKRIKAELKLEKMEKQTKKKKLKTTKEMAEEITKAEATTAIEE